MFLSSFVRERAKPVDLKFVNELIGIKRFRPAEKPHGAFVGAPGDYKELNLTASYSLSGCKLWQPIRSSNESGQFRYLVF